MEREAGVKDTLFAPSGYTPVISKYKYKNANDRDNSIVGVLIFDALFFFDYVYFSCLCIYLYKGFALRTAYLRLPVHIYQPSVALRTAYLFVYQHIITPLFLQEQHNIDIRNEVSAVYYLAYKPCYHALRTSGKSFHHRQRSTELV